MKLQTHSVNDNIELGNVTWYRDYYQALKQSDIQDKPVLLFFQEIPGCSTCVNYGRDVLSYPLMVEFIENEFIPLAIYNNRPGIDAEILKLYNEPSWNNPVTHFVNKDGSDIIPKLANNYQPLSMYYKMVEALSVAGKKIPDYAKILENDLKLQYGYLGVTVYETPCFWSGETTLALHPAVKYTEAGWINGREVVKVFYDTKQTSLEKLDSYAGTEGFFKIGNHADYKIDKAPQYYISKSPFKYLALSKAQRAQINVAIPYKKQPEKYLSPKQAAQLNQILATNQITENSSTYKAAIENVWNWNN